MDEKVTIMVLKVDLQRTKCYKKVKKLLCKYPEIRDQIYDEKANTVTIKVVCSSPENIRNKLFCKGGGTIKGIEIKEPPKPKAPEPEKPKPQVPEQEKPKPPPPVADSKPAEPEKPKTKQGDVVVPPKDAPPAKAPEIAPKAPAPNAPAPAPKAPEPAPAPMAPTPVPAGYPQGPAYPQYGMCYLPYGYNTCESGMGVPAPPPCNCGCGGSRVVSNDNYGRNYRVNCCEYFSEENPAACKVM